MSEGISGWAIGALLKMLFSKLINALPAFMLRRLIAEADFKSKIIIAIKYSMPVAWLDDSRPSHSITGLSLFVANHAPVVIKVSLQRVVVAVPPQTLVSHITSESCEIAPGKTTELQVAEITLTGQQVRFLKSKNTEILYLNISFVLSVNSHLHSYSDTLSTDLFARIDGQARKARR